MHSGVYLEDKKRGRNPSFFLNNYMKREEFDTVEKASRYQLLDALIGFCRLTDFTDELIGNHLPINVNMWFHHVELYDDNFLYFRLSKLEDTYCPCCGPEREYFSRGSAPLKDEELRIIVDYLNLRLDATGS